VKTVWRLVDVDDFACTGYSNGATRPLSMSFFAASMVSRAVASAWRASSSVTVGESASGYSVALRRRRRRSSRPKTLMPPRSLNWARTASTMEMWPPRLVERRPWMARSATDALRAAS
jgi:hypothetical protein